MHSRPGAPSIFVNCSKCSEPLPLGDRFCRVCGQAMDPSAVSAPGGRRETEPDDPWAGIVRRLRTLVGGEYEITRELGRGGMAAVYLARELALDRKVAMKVMSPALLSNQGMIERFEREARTVAKLNHPHIVALYAVRQVEDLHFFTMQFVEGRSLDHILFDSGPLPIRTVRNLLFTIGNALAYAHRRGIVHRDVKPANILVDEEGSAVVTDFGIAKVTQDTTGTNTQTNTIVGTPAYISPEQCYGNVATAASDQYSLGVLAYELLTGHVPFAGTPFVVLQAHTERAVPSIRASRADCPPELETAIHRMLEKNPANRWTTMQHALAELRAAPLPDDDPEQLALAALAIPPVTGRVAEIHSTPPRAFAEARVEPQPPSDRAPYVASVAILALPETLEVGDTITLTAAARNASGSTMPGTRMIWTVDDEHVASVDQQRGEVRALAPGETIITASAGTVSKGVRLVVISRRVAAIQISLPPGSLRVGDSVQLVAKAEDKTHESVSEAVNWMSGDSAVAEISDNGILVAQKPGIALVWAEAQGVRGSARVQIDPADVSAVRISPPPYMEVGDSVEMSAAALGVHEELLHGRVMSWSSNDSNIAAVSENGIVEARAAGRVRLTCTCEGKDASLMLTVAPPSAWTIAISAPAMPVVVGQTLTLQAQALSRHGVPVERKFKWSAVPAALAKVSRQGQVTLLAPGLVTVHAVTEDRDGTVQFEIAPASVPISIPKIEFSESQDTTRDGLVVEASEAGSSRRNLLIGAMAVTVLIVGGWFSVSSWRDRQRLAATSSETSATSSPATSPRAGEPRLPGRRVLRHCRLSRLRR